MITTIRLENGTVLEMHRLDTIGSTSDEARRIAVERNFFMGNAGRRGEVSGVVVTALEQTSGKGRLGREWISGRCDGVYMSIAFPPESSPSCAQNITRIAAVAVFRALEDLFSKAGLEFRHTGNTGIKWPNDVVVDGRKICGILTQASVMRGSVSGMVVGIGVNVFNFNGNFPDELSEKATSISLELQKSGNFVFSNLASEQQRNGVIESVEMSIIENFFGICGLIRNGVLDEDLESEYRELCLNIGKEVSVIDSSQREVMRGVALGVENNGELLVRTHDGSLERLNSGEVSVRGIYGYL